MAKKLLVWLSAAFADEKSLVGEKAVKLHELLTLNLPIPEGFVITTSAYNEFVEKNNLIAKINHLRGSIHQDSTSQIRIEKVIKSEIAHAKFSNEFVKEVFKTYVQLAGSLKNISVTLASSLLKTQPLTLSGEANLMLAIKDVWTQVLITNIPQQPSIIIQKTLSPEKEGVFQTNNLQSIPSEFIHLVETLKKHFYFPQTIHWVQTKKHLYITNVQEYNPSPDQTKEQSGQKISPHTATKIYVTADNPVEASNLALQYVDGVGLLRAEFMMAEIGTHPKKMIDDGHGHEFSEKLAEGISTFAKAFSPRPIVYRASDFKTNEYRQLVGGKEYEPIEPNPMLGYRGTFRYIHDPEVFHLELEAIKRIRNKHGLKNIWLMIPFVRTVKELQEVKALIASAGLYRSPTFKLWMMVEIPSNVILLDKFIEQGIDGVSIGSNDLTMLMLGTDRDNSDVAREFNEQDETMLWAYEHVIKTAHKHGITSSLCGQAASVYPTLLKRLVELGITSVSVSPDAIETTRDNIAKFEKEVMNRS